MDNEEKEFIIVVIEDNEDDYNLICNAIKMALFNSNNNYKTTSYKDFSIIASQWSCNNLEKFQVRQWINSIEQNYEIRGFIIDISLFSGGSDEAGLLIRDFIRDGDIYSATQTLKSQNIPIVIMTSNDNPDMQNKICKKNTKWIIKSPKAIPDAGMQRLDEAIMEYTNKLNQGEQIMSSVVNNNFNGDVKNFQQGDHNTMINQENIYSKLSSNDIENIKTECLNLLQQIPRDKDENLQLLSDLNNLKSTVEESKVDKKSIFEKVENLSKTIKKIKDSETLSLLQNTGKCIWKYGKMYFGIDGVETLMDEDS